MDTKRKREQKEGWRLAAQLDRLTDLLAEAPKDVDRQAAAGLVRWWGDHQETRAEELTSRLWRLANLIRSESGAASSDATWFRDLRNQEQERRQRDEEWRQHSESLKRDRRLRQEIRAELQTELQTKLRSELLAKLQAKRAAA